MAENKVRCTQCNDTGLYDACCRTQKCQCKCRDANVLADVHKAFAKVKETEDNTKRVMGVLKALDNEKAVDAFYKHLDVCERCRNRPMELCPQGAMLLVNTVREEK